MVFQKTALEFQKTELAYLKFALEFRKTALEFPISERSFLKSEPEFRKSEALFDAPVDPPGATDILSTSLTKRQPRLSTTAGYVRPRQFPLQLKSQYFNI